MRATCNFIPKINPANAGKRCVRSVGWRRIGDRPRRCGEKTSVHVQPQAEPGIIPVGAGKSSRRAKAWTRHGDHPRRCGEKFLCIGLGHEGLGSSRECGEKYNYELRTNGPLGSSPRVRGKVAISMSEIRTLRIIPAGAGRRIDLEAAERKCWDHPRGCGEKRGGRHRARTSRGSSPRVRGEAHMIR